MELARKAGNGTVPTASPSDVVTKAATTQINSEYPTPAADGFTVGSKTGSPWIGIARSALAALCLSPLLVAIYSRTVPYAPMKGQNGTWSSDTWQHELPSGFRTKTHGGGLAFYALEAAGPCGPAIGSAPASVADAPARVDGVIGKRKVTLFRDRGLLAVTYDQPDPWAFFTRGPTPMRKVTVRFHQIATEACEG